MQLSQQAFGSPELMEQLGRMDDNLRALRPGEDWDGSERFEGGEGLGLGDGTGALQDLAELDELADQLSQSYGGARLDDVDLDKLARQLGDEAAVDARTLQRARAGAARQRLPAPRHRRRPPALARRRCASSASRCCATWPSGCSGRQGQRDLRQAGAAGEPSGATREWAFGDTEPWDVTRTVTNAVLRDAAEGGSTGSAEREVETGVRLRIDDVEVQETEARTQACVALLVDTSFSMAMDGRWVPMKRTALALHTLITHAGSAATRSS